MITVNCSQCKALLEMDDAFAGGVCRCHYCGTIQTVPAQAKRQGVPAATPAAPQPPAARARGNGAATSGVPTRGDDGLNALADVVASSGLSRGGMQSPPPAAPPPPTMDYARPPAKPLMMPLLLALGVIAALMLVLVFMLLSARSVTTNTAATVSPPVATPYPAPAATPGNPTPAQPPQPGGESVREVPVPKGPQFCGISLDGIPSVVYVLDRGEATAELFDTLKEATYRSVESLKPGQKFQIIFWDNADAPASYPAQGLAPVSAQEIDAARAQFAEVIAGGRAKADAAVQRAVASHPAVIVIVTGKAFDLDNSLVDKVQAAVQGSGTKVHTVALRSDDGNAVLKTIAAGNHGQFRVVTAKELREYSY